jgi:hypothetical protein
MTVKTGDFAEHSRVLWSLFLKLNGGTIKMYSGDVMDRFVVVQHFRLGGVLKWENGRDDNHE